MAKIIICKECGKKKNYHARGMGKNCYQKSWKKNDFKRVRLETLSERFWQKVDRRGVDDCWEWMASKRLGYGRIRVDGKSKSAHRLSWTMHNGKIPDGMQVLHRCDNPSCVNPQHLFLGTVADNVADMLSKGRQKWLSGEETRSSKLTSGDVLDIRRMYSTGNYTYSELAEMFSVSESNVGCIVNRETWKHI